MTRIARRIPAAVPALALACAACASAPMTPGPDPLASIATAPLAGAQWSVLAVDLRSGDTLLSRDPDRRMIPGSTMKLLTVVTALELLGPDFRWETGLWVTDRSDGVDPVESTVTGDVVLTASGDPTLSAGWANSATAPLEGLAGALIDAGVRSVAGSLIVDASSWDSTSVRPSWMVEDLSVPAGASGGAFALAEGVTHVEVRAGAAPGDSAAVRWWPVGEDGFVHSRIVTSADGTPEVRATWLPESRALELVGAVRVGVQDTLVLATRDPVRQAAAALHRVISARGITVENGWRVAWDAGTSLAGSCTTGAVPSCARARRVGNLVSPTLLEVAAPTLGRSQNWVAEQIVRTIGGAEKGRAGWTEGVEVVSDHILGLAANYPSDVRVVDGSGLSAQNLVTARVLIQVLAHARAQPWGQAFRDALAAPGEKETTLETRLAGLEGRVFAKTGTLTNVAALAGYVIDENGRELAFAILVNGSNLPGATVRVAIDRIVRGLAAP